MLEKPVKAIQSHGQHRTQQGKQNEKKNRLDYGCLTSDWPNQVLRPDYFSFCLLSAEKT